MRKIVIMLTFIGFSCVPTNNIPSAQVENMQWDFETESDSVSIQHLDAGMWLTDTTFYKQAARVFVPKKFVYYRLKACQDNKIAYSKRFFIQN